MGFAELSFKLLCDWRRKTIEESTSKGWVPKRQFTMGEMTAVTAVGGLMLLMSIVIPTENPSTAHTVKVIVGMLGFIIGMVGVMYRPVEVPKNPKNDSIHYWPPGAVFKASFGKVNIMAEDDGVALYASMESGCLNSARHR